MRHFMLSLMAFMAVALTPVTAFSHQSAHPMDAAVVGLTTTKGGVLERAQNFIIPVAHADEAVIAPAPSPSPDQGPSLPEVDPLVAIANLLMNWKTMGPLGIGMAIVVLAGQAIKMYGGDFKYKRLTILGLSCVYAVLLGISRGLNPMTIFVSVMVTGGGAVAIYEALKGAGIIKKSPPAVSA